MTTSTPAQLAEAESDFAHNWCKNSIDPNLLANQHEFRASLPERNKGLKHAEELLGKLTTNDLSPNCHRRERLATSLRTSTKRKVC